MSTRHQRHTFTWLQQVDFTRITGVCRGGDALDAIEQCTCCLYVAIFTCLSINGRAAFHVQAGAAWLVIFEYCSLFLTPWCHTPNNRLSCLRMSVHRQRLAAIVEGPLISGPAFSGPAIWSVHYFQVLHFQVMTFGTAFSGPAFSGPPFTAPSSQTHGQLVSGQALQKQYPYGLLVLPAKTRCVA